LDIGFALGSDDFSRAGTFSRAVETVQVGCDQIVTLDVEAASVMATHGLSDVAPASGGVQAPSWDDPEALLDRVVREAGSSPRGLGGSAPLAVGKGDLGAPGAGVMGRNHANGGITAFCDDDDFGDGTAGPEWSFAFIGDADQGSAVETGGKLQLTTDGTTLYHATDNGAFYYQERNGDFRVEVRIDSFPVIAGGDFAKAGLMIRENLTDLSPRVMVQLVANNPFFNANTLQFDYRDENGTALEVASSPVDLPLPLYLAADRRGDTFTVYYSTDGVEWIKPLGAAGGDIDIPMAPTTQVGLMGASYDADVTFTAEFDDFRICQPNLVPVPDPSPTAVCQSGRRLDLVYLVDASGSMTSPFSGPDSKLDVATSALVQTNDFLATNLPGSRSALVTYTGSVFSDPVFNLTQGAVVRSTLTDDLAAVNQAAQAIDQDAIHPDATTPASIALAQTNDLLTSLADPNFLPVVVWLTDGVPNIDSNGNGPLEYRLGEVSDLSIFDGPGFRSFGSVAWLGNYNGAIATYDGEVLANVMYELEDLKLDVPELVMFGVAIQSDSNFREDLLDYGAYLTGGQVFSVTEASALTDALAAIADSLDCGATIGDRVWNDGDGDGDQDAGEPGLPNVTVRLLDDNGVEVDSQVTGSDGEYLFEDVPAGTYTVVVDDATLPTGITDPTFDFDGTATPNQATVTVADDEVQLDVDFGYRLAAMPAMEFDKAFQGFVDVDMSGDVTVGDVLTYTFLVSNVGNVTLTNITIDDPLPGLSAIDCGRMAQVGSLVPGTSVLCSATYTVTEADAIAGEVVNTATADSDQTDPIDDSETVPVVSPPDDCVPGNYKDNFSQVSFSNDDGSLLWSGDWLENDPTEPGPQGGNVSIGSGFLFLHDSPDTGGEPSVTREADLSNAVRATLRFEFDTSYKVDPSDAVTVEVSDDGGVTWTEVDVITGISGAVNETRSYDITAFASAQTQVRFRVSNLYGGYGEFLCINFVEIDISCDDCVPGKVKDHFYYQSFSNNDGPQSWAGPWIEVDGNYPGPYGGSVSVGSGYLFLHDRPNTGGEPSIAREVNMAGARFAELKFAFDTGRGVDRDDEVTLEISNDGGATWTELEVFTNIRGSVSGTRSYDITAFASAQTQVRFRVTNLYGGPSEFFCIDWILIEWACEAPPARIKGKVWNDRDADGRKDGNEGGLEDVTVGLYDSAGTLVDVTSTNHRGKYRFDGLVPATYTVRVASDTLPDGVDVATYDTDGADTPNEVVVTVGGGETGYASYGYRGNY
ncbi:MAG: SdrD B-like domain-containing protein, partial [Acidobacteriota bacterium]